MARLKIFTFPDAVLTQIALPLQRVEKEHQKWAEDMLETMYFAPGIGLAANQVGLLQRLLVLDIEYELDEVKDRAKASKAEKVAGQIITNKKPIVLLNPRIILREGQVVTEEGCLSVPDYNAEVKRAKKLKVEYQDLDGLTKTLSAEDLLAVVIQHEIDHLDGKLFIDRLGPLKKEFAKKKLKQDRVFRDEEDRMGVFDPGFEQASRHKKGL